jgi:excinuclease UvrABC nuclease subunit
MSILLPYLKKLPDEPGVYFFKKGKDILYIGKATSLRDRVRSYLSSDLLKTRSMLIADMVAMADRIEFEKTDSVLEALVLEAELIKKYQPHYNTREKDDKSFLYTIITDEEFPQILLIRKRDLDDVKVLGQMKIKYEFGPFSSGPSLREALKIVRRIFPYRDEKCKAGSGKACFNYQIGLCPGTCVGAISKKDYARTIRNIALFFKGKKSELVKTLKAEMKAFAKEQEFEKADQAKKQIFALEHIRDVSLIKKDDHKDYRNTDGEKPFRIEAYDIAHMQGSAMTGVMVVVEDGIVKKADYRMFKIRRKGINDIASLKEVLERRIGHPEWPMPDLVVTDGGMPQYNVALEAFKNSTAIVGVVKNEKHQPERLIGNPELIKLHQKAVLLANSEAHRFTLKYHSTLRSKNMFGNN